MSRSISKSNGAALAESVKTAQNISEGLAHCRAPSINYPRLIRLLWQHRGALHLLADQREAASGVARGVNITMAVDGFLLILAGILEAIM